MAKIKPGHWLCLSSAFVEHLTHNPEIKSLNPNIGSRRKKMAISSQAFGCAPVVKHSTHSPDIKGLYSLQHLGL